MDMNAYQQEQRAALSQIKGMIASMDALRHRELWDEFRAYLDYRQEVQCFLDRHFGRFCTRMCFESQKSACCSKDGIITFWADHVINLRCSSKQQIDELCAAIRRPLHPNKCIYLGSKGCLWRVRPLGCALFLCDGVQADVFEAHPPLKMTWERLNERAKGYRWPDRPVLFDRLEQIFIEAGCRSPLMYINTSPGLLRIKRNSGIKSI